MAATRYQVESFMDQADLKYFCRECDEDTGWILFFGENTGIKVFLSEGGEFLLIRSMPLLDTENFTPQQRSNLFQNLMARNNKIKLGRYSATTAVTFETSLPIENSELTGKQFHRNMAIVVHEINYFKETASRMQEDDYQEADEIDLLIQRLIEPDGDE